ncbi:MAG: ATP-binding cassette domain-containing protein [Chromatiales bacterium]|nr:MAG: ATP-binding cassette domain-containing protein [Chromatiales bacterium]
MAKPANHPVVVARKLTKRFGERVAVDAIDLDIPAGGCFGLLGPNGAGKTTTLRMVLGQSPMTAGSLTVLGLPMPGAVREIRRRTGVVPQQDNADPDFTVAENLRMYARYFDLAGPVVRDRIVELLEFVELTDRADSPLRELSGGMKRRLSIARALINDPELIVLDEPTTGLDPQVRRMIWTRLRQLRNAGKTLLLTTHYMDEAERLCDELVIVDHGRIISHGHPAQLIADGVEPHVLELQGARSEIESLLEGCTDLRLETVGEMHYAYTRDLPALLGRLEKATRLTYMHRPANLEDVFLRQTGHELRE